MKPYYEDGAVTIYHGNVFEILPTIGPPSKLRPAATPSKKKPNVALTLIGWTP
jgi:hypothetical protein